MPLLRIGLISLTPITVPRSTPLEAARAYPSFGELTLSTVTTMSWAPRYSRTTLVWGRLVNQNWWPESLVRPRGKLRQPASIGYSLRPWLLPKMLVGGVPMSPLVPTPILLLVSLRRLLRPCRTKVWRLQPNILSETVAPCGAMIVAKQACHSRTWWRFTGRVM